MLMCSLPRQTNDAVQIPNKFFWNKQSIAGHQKSKVKCNQKVKITYRYALDETRLASLPSPWETSGVSSVVTRSRDVDEDTSSNPLPASVTSMKQSNQSDQAIISAFHITKKKNDNIVLKKFKSLKIKTYLNKIKFKWWTRLDQKRLSCHADLCTVSRCRTRGESQEHTSQKSLRRIPL